MTIHRNPRTRHKTRPSRARKTPRPSTSRISRPPVTPFVVGLTGPNASGKGEVAKFLRTRGFQVVSLSDVVRDEATRSGVDHTRDNLIRIGVQLREAGGPGALAHHILPRLPRRAVVDSIRNPGEVEVLRGLGAFVLLGIDAPLPLRFDRSLRRGRTGDGATLEEFAAKERRENSTTEAGQQLLRTLALSDAVIFNDATIGTLRRRVRSTLRALGRSLGPGS